MVVIKTTPREADVHRNEDLKPPYLERYIVRDKNVSQNLTFSG